MYEKKCKNGQILYLNNTYKNIFLLYNINYINSNNF